METKSARKVVRVVARVQPSPDPVEKASTRSISVHKPKGDESESVSISFGAQFAGSKDSYKLDYCYEENESTGLFLTKEIRPLISTVFEGKDANVIAHGARCSGKTHLIQGSENEPGISILAMTEMLSMAEERGESISVSVYEVYQEIVYDLLAREKRVVSVLEGAQGKTQLKGLSKVPVKSLSEFQDLYFGLKKNQKLTSDPPRRSHKGVMIHVITGNANSGSLGRMNFLDMAGYEDSRRQNSDLAPLEITKINKSIYALQNVMYALNVNESHVPYRESKLTRMLKDCLQGCNITLLITCLRREYSQDSFYMLNFASRICLGSNRAMTNATKKSNGLARSISLSSAAQRRQTPLVVSAAQRRQTPLVVSAAQRRQTSLVVSAAQRRQTPLVVSATSKQQTGLRGNVTERKAKLTTSASASAIKGRKLFTEANDSVKCKSISKKMEGKARMAVKKEISTSKVVLKVQASSSEEEVCSSFIVSDFQSSLAEEENSAVDFSSSEVINSIDISSINLQETPHEERFSGATYCVDGTAGKAQIVEIDDNNPVIAEDLTLVNEGENLDKENNCLLANETSSPPLSLRLQELSNTLKSICNTSNQPSAPEKYQTALSKFHVKEVSEHSDITAEVVPSVELRTPEKIMPSDIACSPSPWKTFSAHSSKLKNSAVGEYLKFLNTADKEDLKKLRGIGEKRATYIVELRKESPEPFKKLDDLKDIGLSEKQIKGLLRKEIGDIFD